MGIYRIGECDYCGEENKIIRPTPYMADIAMMCENCWKLTEEEYKNSDGVYIGDFKSKKEDYECIEKELNSKSEVIKFGDTIKPSNSISFVVDGIEMLRMDTKGIYVKGKLVENDQEVVEGLRCFLRGQKCIE